MSTKRMVNCSSFIHTFLHVHFFWLFRCRVYHSVVVRWLAITINLITWCEQHRSPAVSDRISTFGIQFFIWLNNIAVVEIHCITLSWWSQYSFMIKMCSVFCWSGLHYYSCTVELYDQSVCYILLIRSSWLQLYSGAASSATVRLEPAVQTPSLQTRKLRCVRPFLSWHFGGNVYIVNLLPFQPLLNFSYWIWTNSYFENDTKNEFFMSVKMQAS